MKVIGLASKEDVYKIFSNLLSASLSISDRDKAVITELVKADKSVLKFIPETIPMKENVALIAGLLLEHTSRASTVLMTHIKSATDILRLVVQLIGCDVSLKEKTRFRLSTKPRKLVMALLNNFKYP